MTIQDVMAMVEQDEWEYTGELPRDGRSMVCSAFVASVWKAGGLLPANVQGTEFAPNDIYVLDIFDTTTPRPAQCVEADPDLPYCQLLGHYRMTLPNFNTLTPYEEMN